MKASLLCMAVAWVVAAGDPRYARPPIPEDNPQTLPKALLGRYLFYDKRVSVNGTASCATCHRQELAFTDGKTRAVGATGEVHPRNSMSLVDVAFNRAFNRSDPTIRSLENHAMRTLLAVSPVELGFPSVKDQFLKLIRTDPVYGRLFREAFHGPQDPYTLVNVAKAIAAFERTIVARDSPYDRFRYGGDSAAISEAAKRGEILFFLDYGPSCFRCHAGVHFTDAAVGVPVEFHNTGLYSLPGLYSYPIPNVGLYAHTKRVEDVGKFKTPTLRNVALTAPYMHDGSIATLEEAVEHYAAGGRARDNPGKDKLVRGFPMTPQNRADLVEFLKSLTDESLVKNPDLSDPWEARR